MAKKGAAPSPLVAVRHRDGVGCAWRGRAFSAGADGTVLVPLEAVPELAAHGFTPAGDDSEAK